MAYCKVLILLVLSVILLISSEASARQLAESTSDITEPKPAEQFDGSKWDYDLHKCKGKGHDHSGYEGGGYGHGLREGEIAPNHKKDKDHNDCGKSGYDSYGQFDNYGSHAHGDQGKGGNNL